MTGKAIQDTYPDDQSHCYGCGRLNPDGLQIKSTWDGEQGHCEFEPQPHHTALPGYVYGGLIASLIDCHGTGTASAAAYQAEGREMGSEPTYRFVTASLHVDFLRPTPIGEKLTLTGKLEEVRGRKMRVSVALYARGNLCARGEVWAAPLPERMMRPGG